LNQAILRYFSQDENKGEFPAAIFRGILISFLLGFIILLVGFQFFLDLDIIAFVIAYISLISIILFRIRSVLLQAGLKAKKVAQITAVQAILGLIIPLIFLIRINHYLAIIAGISLAYLLIGYKSIFSFNKFSTNSITSSNNVLSKYYNFGIPLSFRISLGLFISFLDRWFITFFLNESITGLYAGYSEIIIKVFSIILFPITLAIHPRVTKLWNEGERKKSIQLVKKGIGIQSGIFLLAFVIFILFEKQFFNLSLILIPELSSEFLSLGIPIFISGFLWQISLLVHKPLELTEKPLKMVWAIIAALVVAVVGNIIFLPRIGVIATAYSSIASASVYIIIIILFVLNKRKLSE
jgi:O-antigen/teichoic acid export membrane protein